MNCIYTCPSNSSIFGLGARFYDYFFDENWTDFFLLVSSSCFLLLHDGQWWRAMTATAKGHSQFWCNFVILCDRRIGARALSFTLPAFYSTNPPREEAACGATFTRITSECTCWLELENNSSAMATVTQNTESQIKLKLNFSSLCFCQSKE